MLSTHIVFVIVTAKYLRKIQIRFRLRFIIEDAKCEVLGSMWTKLISEIQAHLVKIKDKDKKTVVKFLEALLMIRPNIQREVMMFYLAKCRELHAIAFFQWRNKFPQYTYVQNEQENLIVEKYDWLYHKRKTGQVPTYDTVIYSELPPRFLEKYGSIFN